MRHCYTARRCLRGFSGYCRRCLGSGSSGSGDDALWFYVKCNACGEIIPVRVNPASDLIQEFEGAGDSVSGYSLHKEVMGRGGRPGRPCFRLTPIGRRLR